MFRVPKDDLNATATDYDDDEALDHFCYELPNDEELEHLKTIAFSNNERDFSTYLRVLEAIGLKAGDVILDYGASWGYLSWLLQQAGYRVYSYEPGRARARYAAEKLNCALASSDDVPEPVDCFFSCHVIEHLGNPRIVWEAASKVLKPKGVIVLFMPNGDPRRKADEKSYHSTWGRVHPLLISQKALRLMAQEYGFSCHIHSPPYDYERIGLGDSTLPVGWELLCVAQRD